MLPSQDDGDGEFPQLLLCPRWLLANGGGLSRWGWDRWDHTLQEMQAGSASFFAWPSTCVYAILTELLLKLCVTRKREGKEGSTRVQLNADVVNQKISATFSAV